MTLLLDTHVLLWRLNDPSLLSTAARLAVGDEKNTVFVSAVAAWEVTQKVAVGKLVFPGDLPALLAANQFLPLPIPIDHALNLATLPMHHRDPFDRMLVAQALVEGHQLVTRDPQIHKYAVPMVLA